MRARPEAPSRANVRAVAAPIPDAAPVMMAIPGTSISRWCSGLNGLWRGGESVLEALKVNESHFASELHNWITTNRQNSTAGGGRL